MTLWVCMMTSCGHEFEWIDYAFMRLFFMMIHFMTSV
jgi:hypothetical protein